QEAGAEGEADLQRGLDDVFERFDPARHRTSSAMRPPTSSSTAAMKIFSARASTRWPRRAPAMLPGRAPRATAAATGSTTSPRAKYTKTDAAAVTTIMNALVAAATRMGTPQNVFSTGTLMIPPPSPRSPDTAPATREAARARLRRRTR